MNAVVCADVRRRLPGYLDGALRSGEHAALRLHLSACANCRTELARFEQLSRVMARVNRVAPPRELAHQIRRAVAAKRSERAWHLRWRDHVEVWLDNMLRPVALPATGGVMAALIGFVVVMQTLFVGVPLGAVPNDVPTNLIQPARLEALAPFAMGAGDSELDEANVLLVEAVVNDRGEAVGYEILSGPKSPAVRRQLDQVLLFSRFRPAMSFGRPVAGGRVVLNLTEVRVRG